MTSPRQRKKALAIKRFKDKQNLQQPVAKSPAVVVVSPVAAAAPAPVAVPKPNPLPSLPPEDPKGSSQDDIEKIKQNKQKKTAAKNALVEIESSQSSDQVLQQEKVLVNKEEAKSE